MSSPEDYYHTMACGGPWYECSGPTKLEALNLIKTHMQIKEKYIPEWVIEKKIDENIKKYSGLGSWRGFHTFTLGDLVDECLKWHVQYNYSMKILKKSKLIVWINHILYRYPAPGSNSEKVGLRVRFHENNFYNNAYTPNSN